MEFSPYLKSIQKLQGATSGEKFKTLNCIARQIIENHRNSEDSIRVHESEMLPELLVPFVRLEIARILRNPDDVIDALKSEDEKIFHRALKVKWFFDGSIKNYPNAQDFRQQVFPYVSLNHRASLISQLSRSLSLSEPKIAEEFYQVVCEMYGEFQARPLLTACGETFIWDVVVNNQIVLEPNQSKYLMQNYPDLVVNYLENRVLNVDSKIRNIYPPFEFYRKCLPNILFHNSQNFVKLLEKFGNPLDIKLDRRATHELLNNEMKSLVQNSKLFMPILSLKTTTKKLSELQFEVIFQNCFPENIKYFHFENLFRYLKYIPEGRKLPLMMATFEKVYKVNLLDCDRKVTPYVLRLLPPEQRISQAWKKLMTDKTCPFTKTNGLENSWICYFPIATSIPTIKDQISKSNSVWKRMCLLNQLIYTCRVNNDAEALIDVLKYITERLETSETWTWKDFLVRLSSDFEVQHLSAEHWDVLNKFIDLCCDKDKYSNYDDEFQDLIICGIHFDLMHNRPISNKIDRVTEANIYKCKFNWSILHEYSEYEKICIKEFMMSIPRIFSKFTADYSSYWIEVIYSFVKEIFEFNKRNLSVKNKVKNIQINNCPVFLHLLRKYITDKSENPDDIKWIKKLRLLLKTNEPDLHDLWINNEEQATDIDMFEAGNILKQKSQEILDNWEKYYELCKININSKAAQRFLRSARWHQNLPIKFIEEDLKNINVGNANTSVLSILVVLSEGSIFEQLLASMLSDVSKTTDEQVNSIKSIWSSLKHSSSTISTDFILHFLTENNIDQGQLCLQMLERRIAVHKLTPFCDELLNKSGRLKKLGIKLFCEISTIDKLRNRLINMLIQEGDTSVRVTITKKIYDTFVRNPCEGTWAMINECFDRLTIDDNKVLKFITEIQRIPNSNKYIVNYLDKLLTILPTICDITNPFKSPGLWYHIQRILENFPINISPLCSEEFHEKILQTYLVDLSLPCETIFAAQKYLIYSYILPAAEKIDVRLKFFSQIFFEILKNHHHNSHNKYAVCHTTDKFLHGLIKNVLFNVPHSTEKFKFINTALEIFLSVLKPDDSLEFYCQFTFGAICNDEITAKKFGMKISEIIPSLIDTFTGECVIIMISKQLFEFIHCNYGSDGDDDNYQLEIIETLMEVKCDRAFEMALLLLYEYNNMNNKNIMSKINS